MAGATPVRGRKRTPAILALALTTRGSIEIGTAGARVIEAAGALAAELA